MKIKTRAYEWLSAEEYREIVAHCTGAIHYAEKIVPKFRHFHRRLLQGRAAQKDDDKGVIAGASRRRLSTIRQLVMMAMLEVEPTRKHFYALQEDPEESKTAWAQLEIEARYWEKDLSQFVDREDIRSARRVLERALRRMIGDRKTGNLWVPV